MGSKEKFEAQLNYLISMMERLDEMILDLNAGLIDFRKEMNSEFACLSKQLFVIEASIKSSWR